MFGYLVHREFSGKTAFLGLYESRAKADEDVRCLAVRGQRWKVSPVPFIAWGFDAVFTNNRGEVVREGVLQ